MTRIVTFTGASGSGKSTIIKGVLAALPHLVTLICSTTTRLKRPSDLEGEYEYVSRPRFEAWERDGAFLWTVEISGEKYGTRKDLVDVILKNPRAKIGLMSLKPEAVLLLKAHVEETLGQYYAVSSVVDSIFISSPPLSALRERMRRRGDPEASVEQRLEECKEWDHFAHTAKVPGGERAFNHFMENYEDQENMAIAHAILRILELKKHL